MEREARRDARGVVGHVRSNALERVVPITLVGRRPMGVRQGAGEEQVAPVRRPRETATWRERWPDVPAVRGARGVSAR